MEREELEHLIRASAEVTHEYEFIIIGSQSILGSIPNPPEEFKASMEADIYPLHAPEKADLIDAAIGEGSNFHDTFRYYAQGVGPDTPTLPAGWQNRLHRIQSPNTDLKIGYCLDVLDLFLAKAFANRDKDREFDMALLQHGFVNLVQAVDMVAQMPVDDTKKRDLRARIRRWSKMLKDRGYNVPDA
ncbi:MAG: hypothetical protein QFF03_15455 [Pseudomonadota bacterium]|nr:hypothetical protein [Pseudomonadota bacterium]